MRTILIALDGETESDRLWAHAQLTELARRLDAGGDEPIALEPPPSHAPTKLKKKIVIAPYSSPDDYREKTGKRFRKTTSQVGRGISRDEAFAEFMEAEVSA